MIIYLLDKDGNLKRTFQAKWQACSYILSKEKGVIDIKKDFEKLLKDKETDIIIYGEKKWKKGLKT